MSPRRKLPDMRVFAAANPGMTYGDVARQFGVTPQAVGLAARKAGVRMTGPRARISTAKLPPAAELRPIVAAEPQTAHALAERYGCVQRVVYNFCKRHGIALVSARHKPFKQIRLNADQVASADAIVTTAAHRHTDFRMTVETSDDRLAIDAAISGLDDLSTALRSGDTSFLAGK